MQSIPTTHIYIYECIAGMLVQKLVVQHHAIHVQQAQFVQHKLIQSRVAIYIIMLGMVHTTSIWQSQSQGLVVLD